VYNRWDIREFLVRSNGDGLNKEFVPALHIWWWIFFHGLKENYAQVSM